MSQPWICGPSGRVIENQLRHRQGVGRQFRDGEDPIQFGEGCGQADFYRTALFGLGSSQLVTKQIQPHFRKQLFIHLPLLLILLTPLATQSNRIDATLSSLLQDARVTGAGIAVFHQGKIEFIKTYGWRDTERHLPLTPDSIMTAASLTKSAFATVVMRLAERHTIDLDKPIYRYLPKPLPEYPSYADLKSDDRYKKLTLRILLSHTSGFPNWRAFEDDRKLKIHFDPGTRYAYSGEGIDLAQLVIETVTGKPLTRLMQDELYAPVQMTRTSMVSEPRFENNFANGYDEYGRSLGPEKRSTPNAAGSMQTTLRDYATCLSALLRGKILNPQTAREMLAPQIVIHSLHQFPSLSTATTAANDDIKLSYGLGWGLYFGPKGPAFFKDGTTKAGAISPSCSNPATAS